MGGVVDPGAELAEDPRGDPRGSGAAGLGHAEAGQDDLDDQRPPFRRPPGDL